MKLLKSEIKGIKFYHREGMSDLKTFEEVIGNETYLKKGMEIKPNENWMDCGGNVGWNGGGARVLVCWVLAE